MRFAECVGDSDDYDGTAAANSSMVSSRGKPNFSHFVFTRWIVDPKRRMNDPNSLDRPGPREVMKAMRRIRDNPPATNSGGLSAIASDPSVR